MLPRLARVRALALATAGIGVAGCSAALPYRGPQSDHFDGKTFHNLAPFEAHGLWDVLRWRVSGPRPVPWPDTVAVAPGAVPPARVETGIRITFVNHATVLIQMGGVNILTDPVWSDYVGLTKVLSQKRHKPPGIPFEALPPIDVVLVSHNHYDHLDLPTLRRLQARDAPLIVAGLGTARLLERHGIARALDLDWWQAHDAGALRITFAPAQHTSARSLGDRDRNLWGSYHLRVGDRTVYFAGDTGDGPHFQAIRERLGAPDVALLPIGAYLPRWFMRSQHVEPAESVQAHLRLHARRSVAIHWGTFHQAGEGMNDPPAELARALARGGVPAADFVVLENGEAVELE